MRNNSSDYRNNRDNDTDARWLHGHHHGQNSDRGNYTVDTHFNRGYGRNAYSQYGDNASFNSNADARQMSSEGRFGPGGAQYAGQDFAGQNRDQGNRYGMSYEPSGRYNSGRHYDARADYSNRDYDDLRNNEAPRTSYSRPDERFGHDVRSHGDNERMARGSMGDYESYRRYEQGNPNYDNDYSGGFAGRNYTPGATHYGEGSHNSNLKRWQHQRDEQRERYLRDRDRR